MKKALLLAGALMLVSAPLHAYVSSGSVLGKRYWHNRVQGPTTTSTTDPATITDPYVTDPTIGFIDVRDHRESCSDPGDPVPEPGTMAITSLGLLAAAALRKKRGQKEQQKQS